MAPTCRHHHVCNPSLLSNFFADPSLILTFLFLLLSPSLSKTLGRQCLPPHHDALLHLKQGFNVSANPKSALLSWVSRTDCCLWEGVTCSGSSSEVVGLHLHNQSISGSVEPAALLSLTSLTSLDLSFNSLDFSRVSSSTPGFELLANLNYLNLSTSGFEGQVPRSIGNLKELVSLDFSNKYGYPEVKIVDPKLETLLQNLSNLQDLYLDNVIIPGAACSDALYDSVPKLRALRMHGCSVSRPIEVPVPLSKPRFMTELSVKRKDLSSTQPNVLLSKASQIRYFLASKNNLSGGIPSSICRLTSLEVLDLSENKLSGQIPHCLAELSGLTFLNLRGNSLEGTLPPTFFASNCSIQTLDLNSNQLSGGVPTTLSNCKALEFLNLGNNQFSGPFPRMTNHAALRTLILRSNKFQGTLESLDLHSNMLQILDLSSNNFSGALQSESFSNLTAMMSVGDKDGEKIFYGDLGYYQQSFIITCKGNDLKFEKIYTKFKAISLANNTFHSNIPDVISNLTALKLLDLSHNHLFGSIPSSFGKLRELESLVLSWNNLTGGIPMQLTSLNFLSYLDLSYNSLSGRIPQNGQFDTFNSSSYKGNDKLCGYPILAECQAPPSFHENRKDELNDYEIWLEHWMIYICFAFGFSGGLVFAVSSLLIWNEGRRWLYFHIDNVFYKAPPSYYDY